MNVNEHTYDKYRYPVGVQVFEDIRREGMLYVDKTRYVYELTRRSYSYFLSRPRRFGKSLLLSTIAAYFQGKKELFEGLAIYELEREWVEYPVIRIDLSAGLFNTVAEALEQLDTQLKLNAEKLGVQLTYHGVIGRFQELISRARNKYAKNVVLLIDEYDKPLLETMYECEELHSSMHQLMRGFYGCVKASSEYLRFVMITGVTKFTHVNVFSGLNNLFDISLEPWCNTICGISESEIQEYFKEDLDIFSRINNISPYDAKEGFKKHYDGYRFAKVGENIYNPFSVMRAFASMEFGEYWFHTGTPNHLIRSLVHENFEFDKLSGISVTVDALSGAPSIDGNPVGLLFQSGYLTIKSFEDGIYTLDFPNKEVETGFYKVLLSVQFSNSKKNSFSAAEVRIAAVKGDPSRLIELLKMGLSDYNVDQTKDLTSEAILNSLLYGLVHAIGLDTKAEYHTANGRIDMVIETGRFIYLMEFKVNSTAEVALRQINKKNYADKFVGDKRVLFKIGLNFDSQLRQISDVIIEKESN